MRLDRIVSLYVFRYLAKIRIDSGKPVLPMLMYHSISDDAETGVTPYYKTSTSPELFAQHLHWLSNEGFRSVSLEEGIRVVRKGGREKVVVITFDDGFRDFYDSAFPILKSHDHTATVFLPTAFIGQDRRSFKTKECLTWNEVRELHNQGIEFGSHTVNHPVLYDTPWREIENQLVSSKQKLEDELDKAITSFAYPYAFPQQDWRFTGTFRKLLQEQGYRFCVTTMIGLVRAGDDLLGLKRLPINNCDDKPLFLAKLNGAYDWLASPQSWFKSACHYLGRTSRKEVDLHTAAESL